MAKPDLNKASALLGDRRWRLNNLYYIEDKHGEVVVFKLNPAQQKLLDELHYLNIILKARQMGFSTFILLMALDCCVFNSNLDAGIVADTLDNAKGLLNRIKFSYARMPKDIRQVVTVTIDNALEMRFANGSSIEVGVSLRSSTKNFVHISEYGKICAQSPDKAGEIRAGALNTLAQGQLGFIESTAAGKSGDFYNKTSQARKIADEQRVPLAMEWKFHFFPWFADKSYKTDSRVRMTADEKRYFADLRHEHGITLIDDQKHWYVLKWREQEDDIQREYPSTPDEAFASARDGAYFGKAMQALRQRGRLGDFDYVSGSAVNTFWDLGVSDSTAIWMHQEVAGRHRFVGYYENSGEGMAHYIDYLNRWRVARDATFGRHFGPHDVEHRKQGLEAKSIRQMAAEVGFYFEVVARTPDKQHTIQAVRNVLPECEFDASACHTGILHLENYSRDWDDRHGVWKNRPRHDEHSHAADAFMAFAEGFSPVKPVRTPRFKPRVVA